MDGIRSSSAAGGSSKLVFRHCGYRVQHRDFREPGLPLEVVVDSQKEMDATTPAGASLGNTLVLLSYFFCRS